MGGEGAVGDRNSGGCWEKGAIEQGLRKKYCGLCEYA